MILVAHFYLRDDIMMYVVCILYSGLVVFKEPKATQGIYFPRSFKFLPVLNSFVNPIFSFHKQYEGKVNTA